MNKDSLFRGKITPDSGYIHFIAIGGIGMSGLAKVLLEMGYKVSGSDLKSNDIVRYLEENGAVISMGHRAENVKDCALVVVSTAIKQDNCELIEAKRQNVPVIHRAQLLEFLMSGFSKEKKPVSIGVTGTHGKTTTSGMTAFAFQEAGLKPSFALGGQLPVYNINSQYGDGNYFISELDESDGSIELYTPDISVITNIELDHADHYTEGLEQIYQTFQRYIYDLDKDSKIIINTDDKGNIELLSRIKHGEIITYSTNSEHPLHFKANYRAEIIQTAPNAEMKVYKEDALLGEISFGVAGIHNISNGLAAVAVALESGIEFSAIASAMQKFSGMKRRFQTIGYAQNTRIIDDYAHHPTEIEATLKTAREIVNVAGKGRIISVFQPHRYTRLENLWVEFVQSFKDADIVYLCDVYSAGEDPVEGINSERLSRAINNTKCIYVAGGLEEIAKYTAAHMAEYDLVLTMGAGNITYLGQMIIDASAEKSLTEA